jgi:hypothetical protein
MTSPMRRLIRKNQRYAGSAIRRIATTVTATMRPADPLRLNPERLPDSGSINFILPPVRKPSQMGGEGFYLAEKPASGVSEFCVVVTPFLDVYWMGITQYIMPPPNFPQRYDFK